MNKKEQAVHEYTEAYKNYAAVSITQEEAAIRFNSAMREALDQGVSLQTLRTIRRSVDDHAEFMTDWK